MRRKDWSSLSFRALRPDDIGRRPVSRSARGFRHELAAVPKRAHVSRRGAVPGLSRCWLRDQPPALLPSARHHDSSQAGKRNDAVQMICNQSKICRSKLALTHTDGRRPASGGSGSWVWMFHTARSRPRRASTESDLRNPQRSNQSAGSHSSGTDHTAPPRKQSLVPKITMPAGKASNHNSPGRG